MVSDKDGFIGYYVFLPCAGSADPSVFAWFSWYDWAKSEEETCRGPFRRRGQTKKNIFQYVSILQDERILRLSKFPVGRGGGRHDRTWLLPVVWQWQRSDQY